jgi:asparagine synthase (glutamine-hydrolysing)
MSIFGFAGPPPDVTGRATSAPHLQRTEGITVALSGGPVWLAGREAERPAEAVLGAYRASGDALLRDLTGRFALAIVDEPRRRALLALDRMGIERLAYGTRGDTLVFGHSAAEVARSLAPSPSLRPQALFDFLLLHMVPAPQTVFEGVHKLRPGTCARFDSGRLAVERYWQPDFTHDRSAPFEPLRDELLAALRHGVAACRPDAETGAFLSGGLDSSTVAGMLGEVSGRPPRTFSIGFGVDEFNELDYARIAARRFRAEPHEYDVTADDVVDAFLRIAAAFDEPFGNSSALPSYFCARLAREHGVNHLLAGDGGDELFGGNERYARQKVFEAWWRLPGVLRNGIVGPFAARIDPASRITPLRKLRSYVDQASIRLPERLESWNFMYRTDLGAMLEPGFRASIDTRAPLEAMAEVYAEAPTENLLQQLLFYDWHYTLADSDLRKVGEMCALAGVAVSYPMLDPRVIDVSLQVPPEMLLKGFELRHFYKLALRGFLPDEILAKKKHGFGLPFGVWLKTHTRLGELVYGLLGDLKGRGIVRPAFIDQVIAEHRAGHPGYYGYAIWDLAMLEAWLDANAAGTVPAVDHRQGAGARATGIWRQFP